MKFIYFADRIHPADEEAAAHVANMTEGDELELVEAKRTTQQNKSIHKYCAMLAFALDSAGFDQRTFPWREGLRIPFTGESVKVQFWRPIQEALLNKSSTTKLDPKEVNVVYQAVDKAISERTAVHVEFPSRDSQMREALDVA